MNRHGDAQRVLLLTATVTPHPQMGALVVRAPDERFEQYRAAFGHLVSSGATELFDAIVLCENSGFPLERFDDVFADSQATVVYAPVAMDESAGKYGRGYSEMLLIDRALEQVGDVVGEGDRIWKLTGRYQIKNLAKVVSTSTSSADVVVSLRKYPSKWADLYLFGFNLRAWRALSAHLDELKAASGSVVMYDLIDGLSAQGIEVTARLGAEPILAGVRGHDQRNYDSGTQRLKRRARQFLHIVAPGLRV
ncbi:hypothetical protein ITJ43_11590 [Microbacterium sp. VKM Ac-2870]|uniref:hypothetical protein n=1 Tax=Microbacterium sp. VKM Ac-2870 TaxID=2783825 RepID=UPI00188C5A31|nr:hypothetical protein [Microbacterium sp. VKM Ac-2870]MBF4562782.1 hypothetical protein [Microbacterium sp. VKM Ac-2870]